MATLGYGSSITGSSINTVGEVQTVGFSLSADSADTTSTLSQYASGVPTTIKSNTIFVSCLYDGGVTGEAKKFVDEFKNKLSAYWTIIFPEGKFVCEGYVSAVTVAAAYDQIIRMDITINLTGEPQFSGT